MKHLVSIRRSRTYGASPDLLKRRGFTLIEICLVLIILAVIAGMVIPMSRGMMSTENLREAARELQIQARTARQAAIAENRPYALSFTDTGFYIDAVAPGEAGAASEPLLQHTVADGVEITIQRWGEEKLRLPKADRWIFQPSGLCEPVRVAFTSEPSYIQLEFNPLTGGIQDEEYYFP